MKVLLINPPAIDSIVADMSDYFDKSGGAYPPIGLMYLAACLQRDGRHTVRIVDANLNGHDYAALRDIVAKARPDVVGITALTFNMPTILQMTADIKAVDPRIRVVLGGPHVSIFPEESLAFPTVDYIVLGEGEEVFEHLLDVLEAGGDPEGMEAVGFKRNGEPVLNRTFHAIEDLDRLPTPAVDLVEIRRYFSVLSRGRQTMVMMSSRGCPFQCIYCDRPHLGRRFRARSAGNVVDEMELHVRQHGINDIKFFDDTFTVDRNRVVAICEEIRRRNLAVTWAARARVNTVDYDLLKLMRDSGLRSLSFGIESGNQRILDILQKGITIEQVVSAVGHCRKLGIEVLGDFILGNPGEKREEALETLSLARALCLDYAQFTIMTPYPSTKLYAMGLEKGIIKKDYWREFARNPSKDFVTPVWEEFYTKAELVALLRKAYRLFYFRPSYILGRVARLGSWNELVHKANAFFSLVSFHMQPRTRLEGNFRKQSDPDGGPDR